MFLLKKLLRKIWFEVILGKEENSSSDKNFNPWIARIEFLAVIVAVILGVKGYDAYKAYKKAEAERIAASMYNGLLIPEFNEEAWSLVYNRDYFVTLRPDVKEYFGDLPDEWFYYFSDYGVSDGQRGSETFDPVYYKENNPDLQEQYGDDWRSYYYHFMNIGYEEGRKGAE